MKQAKNPKKSHERWKPKRMVVKPWETGLINNSDRKKVIEEVTKAIEEAMNK